jgi:hypothetical protein
MWELLSVFRLLCLFPLIIALVMPVPYYQAAGQNDLTKTTRDIMTASASWTVEEEGATFTMILLFVTRSDAGVEVFVSLDTFETSLFGRLLTEDDSIFEIDRNLDSAKLHPVTVDVCQIDQIDENGDCTEVVETVGVEAEWNSVDPKSTFSIKNTIISSANTEMFLFHSTQKMATASGNLNDDSLGDDLFASIGKAKGMEFDYGPPSKSPTLSEFGNKGFVAANAFWSDTTIDGQSANVNLRVREDIRGETVIELTLITDRDDDGFAEFLRGEITIPKDGDDVFTMDMRKATAELSPVSITVCDIELANECADAQSAANYTIEATWDGIESSAIASRFTMRDDFGKSKFSSDTDAVSMRADASGSIEGTDMGDSSVAFLFHFSTLRAEFK